MKNIKNISYNHNLLIATIIIFFILLQSNCSKTKMANNRSDLTSHRIEMLGNLLNLIINIKPPEYQPQLPEPIAIIKDFEPIPTDDPDYVLKLSEFWATINPWRGKKPLEVIRTIKSLKNLNDTAYRFLIQAYVEVDSLEQAIIAGEKISDKDSTVLKTLGICSLNMGDFDAAINYFDELKKDELHLTFAIEQIGNAYFKKYYKSITDSSMVKDNESLKAAIKQWEQVHKLSDVPYYLTYAIGVGYFLLENYEKARYYFQEIYNKEETFLLTRIYILLSLRNQDREKALSEFLESVYKESGDHEDVCDLIKAVIAFYYFLGEDQFEIGEVKKARKYWQKAKSAIDEYEFCINKSIHFLYLKAIITQAFDEVYKENEIYNASSGDFKKSVFVFKELYDSLKVKQNYNSKNDNYAKYIGNILFLLNKKEYCLKFYQLVQKPDLFTYSNIYAIRPNIEIKPSLNLLNSLPVSSYSFYIALNFARSLFFESNYEQAIEVLDELIKHGRFIKEIEKNIYKVLLLQFCNFLQEKSSAFYKSKYDSLDAEKDKLERNREDLSFIDYKLEKVLEARKEINDKIDQIQSNLSKIKNDRFSIPNYIFVPAEPMKTNRANIIIIPELSSHKIP